MIQSKRAKRSRGPSQSFWGRWSGRRRRPVRVSVPRRWMRGDDSGGTGDLDTDESRYVLSASSGSPRSLLSACPRPHNLRCPNAKKQLRTERASAREVNLFTQRTSVRALALALRQNFHSLDRRAFFSCSFFVLSERGGVIERIHEKNKISAVDTFRFLKFLCYVTRRVNWNLRTRSARIMFIVSQLLKENILR